MNDLKETLKEKVNTSEATNVTGDGAITQGQPDVCEDMEREIHNESVAMQQSEIVMPAMATDIQGAKERITELQEFIKYMMVPNNDYGFIPGCPKPKLFKSGAEKLCDIYGLTKRIEVVKRMEDWDKGIFHYEVKATLINKRNGCIESEGVGSCNNREKKFAGQDPFSVVNSILKMAKKRAIVDAMLAATRTSGIFSQDLDNHAA